MSDHIIDPNRLLTKRSITTCLGYDYGVPAYALLAVDPSFINLLYEAKIVGCAYGFMPSEDLDTPMRVFSLVAQNEGPARRAFEIFKIWGDAIDADCVQLEIVILADGGYLLTVGPDPHQSEIRLAGYGSLFQPMTMAHTYVKRLDTVSKGLFDLRDYKKLPISPVVFTASVTSAREPTANMSLRPIIGCPELIKFVLKISEEEDARRNPFMSALIDGGGDPSGDHGQRFVARQRLESKQIAERRTRMLKDCFPVTLHRIKVSPSLSALKNTLTGQGLSHWQVDQAICNLQIADVCHRYLLSHVDREEADAPLGVLASRFEDVLTPFHGVDLNRMEEQMVADAQYLIGNVDPHLEPATTLFECAAQLAHLGVLNG